jgi:cytochrome c oxidase subunit II
VLRYLSLVLLLAALVHPPASHPEAGGPAPHATGAPQQDVPANGARVIPITAKRFNFSPAQITVKKGETVTLRLTSEDVTHGFYMKPLKIDEVIEPGKPTDVTITPQAAGTFTTICDHFCGSGHGNMHMTIVVE